MRPWLTHLMSSANAVSDFREAMKSSIASLNKTLAKTVRENDMETARGIAHEIKVYEELLRVVRSEQTEQTAQARYQPLTNPDDGR